MELIEYASNYFSYNVRSLNDIGSNNIDRNSGELMHWLNKAKTVDTTALVEDLMEGLLMGGDDISDPEILKLLAKEYNLESLYGECEYEREKFFDNVKLQQFLKNRVEKRSEVLSEYLLDQKNNENVDLSLKAPTFFFAVSNLGRPFPRTAEKLLGVSLEKIYQINHEHDDTTSSNEINCVYTADEIADFEHDAMPPQLMKVATAPSASDIESIVKELVDEYYLTIPNTNTSNSPSPIVVNTVNNTTASTSTVASASA